MSEYKQYTIDELAKAEHGERVEILGARIQGIACSPENIFWVDAYMYQKDSSSLLVRIGHVGNERFNELLKWQEAQQPVRIRGQYKCDESQRIVANLIEEDAPRGALSLATAEGGNLSVAREGGLSLADVVEEE